MGKREKNWKAGSITSWGYARWLKRTITQLLIRLIRDIMH